MLFQTSCRRLAAKPVSMPLRAKINSPAVAGNASRHVRFLAARYSDAGS
jgi:hypothetical protein